MVLPVHLRLSAVVAIVDCPDRSQLIGSRSLKQAAPQSIWLFQESRIRNEHLVRQYMLAKAQHRVAFVMAAVKLQRPWLRVNAMIPRLAGGLSPAPSPAL
jgi:hypothetical protein